jgi:hypothetical protein
VARKRFTGDWGPFEWACVVFTTIVLGGVLAAVFLTMRSFPGDGGGQTDFENVVETYLETRSRYRHSLDWRGEVESVRCAEVAHSFHGCDIRFANIGTQRWSGGWSSVGVFRLSPCLQRLGTHALGEVATPCGVVIEDRR